MKLKKFLGNNAIIFGMFILFSFVIGVLNGAGFSFSETTRESVADAQYLVLIIAFCIAGCRVQNRRAMHIFWLAVSFWTVNNLVCLGMSLQEGIPTDSEWMDEWIVGLLVKFFVDNLFLTVFCAAIGGVFSMAIMEHRRNNQKETT